MTEEQLQKVRQEIREKLFEQINHSLEISDEEVQELIEEEIVEAGKNQYIPLAQKDKLRREIYFSVRKYDVLQELLEDNSVTEIMVNGKDHIFIEKNGHLAPYAGCFESREKLFDVIQQIVAKANRVVNESNPIVDARLAGSRVHVVLEPIALNGPILTIRRFPEHPITMEDLLRMGSITQEAAQFLHSLVVAGYNIFISGGTGSGKTTFLNVLSGYIPPGERVITIEDSAELSLQGIENIVRMETRNANIEGCREISIRDLIKASLRMRPDRIIVGEVRGGEALDMLQALNTGHDGALSTDHANSARDMLTRLETMVLMAMDLPLEAIRRQIASGLDIIVHLGRLRDKSRKVISITEILDFEAGQIRTSDLFTFEETGDGKEGCVEGTLVRKNQLMHVEKLHRAGIVMR